MGYVTSFLEYPCSQVVLTGWTIELPSLMQLVSLESLCFYEAHVSSSLPYITDESFCHFSRINFILPANIKEIRFGLHAYVIKEQLRHAWEGIDEALSDPRLKSLELLGIRQYSGNDISKFEPYFRECMPKSQAILQLEDDDK